MKKNSFTFNFRGLAVITSIIFIVAILEGGSFLLLRVAQRSCTGQDLIRLNGEFFCKNIKARCPSGCLPLSPIKLVLENPYYDVFIIGSSVTQTNWPEKLYYNYGITFLRANPCWDCLIKFPVSIKEFEDICRKINHINRGRRAILLFALASEHYTYNIAKLNKISLPGKMPSTPLIKLVYYAKEKVALKKNPKVAVLRLKGQNIGFYTPHLDCLNHKINYSEQNLADIANAIDTYNQICKNNNIILVIVNFPTKAGIYESAIKENLHFSGPMNKERTNSELLKSATKEKKVYYLDLESAISTEAIQMYNSEDSMLWNNFDAHMNDAGDAIVANKIASLIATIKDKRGLD